MSKGVGGRSRPARKGLDRPPLHPRESGRSLGPYARPESSLRVLLLRSASTPGGPREPPDPRPRSGADFVIRPPDSPMRSATRSRSPAPYGFRGPRARGTLEALIGRRSFAGRRRPGSERTESLLEAPVAVERRQSRGSPRRRQALPPRPDLRRDRGSRGPARASRREGRAGNGGERAA